MKENEKKNAVKRVYNRRDGGHVDRQVTPTFPQDARTSSALGKDYEKVQSSFDKKRKSPVKESQEEEKTSAVKRV